MATGHDAMWTQNKGLETQSSQGEIYLYHPQASSEGDPQRTLVRTSAHSSDER